LIGTAFRDKNRVDVRSPNHQGLNSPLSPMPYKPPRRRLRMIPPSARVFSLAIRRCPFSRRGLHHRVGAQDHQDRRNSTKLKNQFPHPLEPYKKGMELALENQRRGRRAGKRARADPRADERHQPGPRRCASPETINPRESPIGDDCRYPFPLEHPARVTNSPEEESSFPCREPPDRTRSPVRTANQVTSRLRASTYMQTAIVMPSVR